MAFSEHRWRGAAIVRATGRALAHLNSPSGLTSIFPGLRLRAALKRGAPHPTSVSGNLRTGHPLAAGLRSLASRRERSVRQEQLRGYPALVNSTNNPEQIHQRGGLVSAPADAMNLDGRLLPKALLITYPEERSPSLHLERSTPKPSGARRP